MRQQIEQLEDFVNNRKGIVNQLEQMFDCGQNHKEELYRDCSTFELNMAQENDNYLVNEIETVKAKIISTVGHLGDTLKQAKEKGGSGWLTDEQQSEVFDYGTKLRRLKQIEKLQQAAQKENHGFMVIVEEAKDIGKNAFSAGLMKKMLKRRSTMHSKQKSFLMTPTEVASSLLGNDDSFPSPKNALLGQLPEAEENSQSEYEPPNRAQVVMTMLLMHKEKMETQYVIGGRVCFIKASYVNGNV